MQNTFLELAQKLRQHPSYWAKLAFTDFDGLLRGKIVGKEKLISTLELGQPFKVCNIIFGWDLADTDYEDASLSTASSGNPDLELYPDPETLRFIPWEENMPFLICDVFQGAKPHPLCPRSQLKAMHRKIRQDGHEVLAAYELEANLFQRGPHLQNPPQFVPVSTKLQGLSLHAFSETLDFYRDCLEFLPQWLNGINAFHQESGPGMIEISLLPRPLLEAADQCVRLKYALRELGLKHQLVVSFMAKWDANQAGCGAHQHLSVFKNEANLLAQSRARQAFLAGWTQLLPHLMPFLAPTVNSYRRYVEEEFAPIYFDWGEEKRSVAWRLLNVNSPQVRIENRLPGADVNPYWGLWATVIAGFFGLDHQLQLTSAQPLPVPQNLMEAILLMHSCPKVHELLPEQLFSHMLNTRLWEWRQWKESFAGTP